MAKLAAHAEVTANKRTRPPIKNNKKNTKTKQKQKKKQIANMASVERQDISAVLLS